MATLLANIDRVPSCFTGHWPMRLDAHQHFWQYSPAEYSWISGDMPGLKKNFLPVDLEALLTGMGFAGSVAVQARQTLEETQWLLDLAQQHSSIAAVVGWVDLCSDEVRTELQRFCVHRKFAGVRHVVQDEPDDEFLLRPEFRRGIAQLSSFGLTYDLLLHPRHLPAAIHLAREFPHQPFVLDHLSKPNIAEQQFSPWRQDFEKLALLPNVCCKLSGMVTEARWRNWQPSDFQQYLEIALGAFGWSRLMIGSDWPVCTLSGAYEPVMNLVIDFVSKVPAEAQEAILGGNCARFYNIPSE